MESKEDLQRELENLKITIPEDFLTTAPDLMDKETAAGFLIESMKGRDKQTIAAAVKAFLGSVDSITQETAYKCYKHFFTTAQ